MTDTAALSAPPLGQDVDSEVHAVKTFNGYAWYSASHAAASLAIADAQAWESQMTNGATATPNSGMAPKIGAAAGVFGAAGVWGNLGVSTANLVMGTLKDNTNNANKAASLQITITNNSSRTIVLYKARPANADIVNVVPPLASGESGVFVIASGKGFSSTGEGKSKLDLIFRVGGGQDYLTNLVTNSTYVEFNFEYVLPDSTADVSSPGRWTLQAGIDSSDKHAYGIGMNTLQLYGGTFIGNPGSPAFSFYTYSIETGTGQIDIVFYDCAAGAQGAAPVCLISQPTGGRVSGVESVYAVIVGSMNYLSGVNLTVTQASDSKSSVTLPMGLQKERAQGAWNTTAQINNQPQFPNGWYQLSVSATNNSNLTGTSELVYVAVDN
jgi:hypothetical protein